MFARDPRHRFEVFVDEAADVPEEAWERLAQELEQSPTSDRVQVVGMKPGWMAKHLADTEEPGETVIDWRVIGTSGGVSMEGNGVLVVKVTTPSELIEALDGLHTLAIENLGDAISAPYVEALARAIAVVINLSAIKRPTS